jgi:hypothetical protein
MHAARTPLVSLIALCCASPAAAFQVKLSDEGLPLRWPAGEVSYHLDPQGGLPVPAPAFTAALDAAFAAWAAVPEVPMDLARGPDAPGGFGYEPGARNASVVRYEQDTWEYEPDALMLTFTNYRVADGAIVDSDILINGVDYRWRADARWDDEDDETFDLQNSLTHEAGHFLGLAHSPDHPEATMFPSTTPGELSKRHLAADDTDGLDYLYVAAAPLPGDAPPTGCSVGHRGSGATAPAALLLILAAVVTRKRPRAAGRDRWSAGGRGRWGAALLAAAVLLSAAAGGATTLRYRSVEELVRAAAVVVQGRVVATHAHRDGRLIVTDTTLRVARCLRGACGATVVVRQPGGEVGGVGLHVEGTFRARPGEEVLLFLRPGRDGVLTPVGMVQGALRIERPRGGSPVAVRELGGVAVARPGVAHPELRQVLPLAALVADVAPRPDRRSR